MNCNHCEGTGFLNIEQVPESIDKNDPQKVLDWILEMKNLADRLGGCSCHISPPCSFCTDTQHDVCVCDCCGDGDGWYGVPGEHYNADDPRGPRGPYAENGGLCKCH
jgi:hypothetical protein